MQPTCELTETIGKLCVDGTLRSLSLRSDNRIKFTFYIIHIKTRTKRITWPVFVTLKNCIYTSYIELHHNWVVGSRHGSQFNHSCDTKVLCFHTGSNVISTLPFSSYSETDCCTRQLCGIRRPWKISIVDNQSRTVMELHRPLRCSTCWFPCYLQVYAG